MAIVLADLSALQVPGLVQEVDGTTVRLVDDHGHVQAVLRLRGRDGSFRVEDATACSPG